MKVDLNSRFRGFDGNELGGDNIATAVAEALFNYGKDKPVGYAYQGGMRREPDGRRLRPGL